MAIKRKGVIARIPVALADRLDAVVERSVLPGAKFSRSNLIEAIIAGECTLAEREALLGISQTTEKKVSKA